MSTGDIRGNIAQLERSLKHLKYPAGVDAVGLSLGDPLAALPILHFALLKFSRHVAAYIMNKGVQLQGKTDEAFVKAAFKLFRDMGLKVVITPSQFLEQGFAERKVLLLCSVVQAVREIHTAAVKQERAKTLATYRPSPAKLAAAAAASPPRGLRVERGGVTVGGLVRSVPDGSSATDASQSIYGPVSLPDMWAADDIVNKLVLSHQKTSKADCSTSRSANTPAAAETAVSGASMSQQAQQQLANGGSSSHAAEPCVKELLVSAGLLPLQQQDQQQLLQPLQQQQQQYNEEHTQPQKPLRSALWPQFDKQQQQQHVHPVQQQQQHVHPVQQQQRSPASPVQQQQRHDDDALSTQRIPGRLRPHTTRPHPYPHPLPRQQQQQEQQPSSRHAAAANGVILAADESSEMLGASSSWQPAQEQQQRQPQKCRQQLPQQQQQDEEAGSYELQQQQDQVGGSAEDVALWQQQAVGVVSAATGASLMTVSDMLQLKQQLSLAQAAVQQLQVRLDETQHQLAEQRLASAKYEESASARITVLEGRVRFLENQLSSQQQQQRSQQQQQRSQQQQQQGRSPVAAVATALRSSTYPAAQQYVSRLSQQSVSQATSPATIHTTAAPLRQTPLHSSSSITHTAAAAAGGSSSNTAEDIDWRSAASAAAAAVVAGLAASPMASPVSRPRACSELSGLSVLQQQQQQGIGGSAVAKHGASAAAGQQQQQQHVSTPASQPGAVGTAASCDATASGDRATAAAAAAVCVDRRAGTGQLIDQLASRAVEAQQLLQALRGSKP